MSNSLHSRFVPSEEIDARTVVPWRFGMVDASGLVPVLPREIVAPVPEVEVVPQPQPQQAPQHDAAELEAQLAQAREQAYAEGRQQGLEQGRVEAANEWRQRMDSYIASEGNETAQRLQSLQQKYDESLQALEQNMASELLQLACDIARQVVRQELNCKPQALLPVVREALDMLVTEGRAATVRLNPADWQVLDAPLRAEHAHSKVQWLADAAVPAGDVRVESGGSVIDAGLDSRWRRAVAALGLVSSWYEVAHEQ